MSGYGSEVWCLDGIISGRYARGWRAVAQALYRRLTTPRGDLWFLVEGYAQGSEEMAYGFDISEWIGTVGLETAIASLPSQIEAECAKDPRVAEVEASVVEVPPGPSDAGTITLEITIRVALVDSEENFELSIAASEVDSFLIYLEAA